MKRLKCTRPLRALQLLAPALQQPLVVQIGPPTGEITRAALRKVLLLPHR